MKKCMCCGKKVNENAGFCTYCGAELTQTADVKSGVRSGVKSGDKNKNHLFVGLAAVAAAAVISAVCISGLKTAKAESDTADSSYASAIELAAENMDSELLADVSESASGTTDAVCEETQTAAEQAAELQAQKEAQEAAELQAQQNAICQTLSRAVNAFREIDTKTFAECFDTDFKTGIMTNFSGLFSGAADFFDVQLDMSLTPTSIRIGSDGSTAIVKSGLCAGVKAGSDGDWHVLNETVEIEMTQVNGTWLIEDDTLANLLFSHVKQFAANKVKDVASDVIQSVKDLFR